MGNMPKRQQPKYEQYTTEGHPDVFNERRVNPHKRMVYNWPLITNTRAGEIDEIKPCILGMF